MCRWLAYSGKPVRLAEVIFETEHSLIDQSLSSHNPAATTNGDGFGVGWYDQFDLPGLYKHIQPAWNDPNLRDLCGHIISPMFLAHVRAATGSSAIQQSNCHPFRHGRWLFMHNGKIREFDRIKRKLALHVSEELYPHIKGTTDTELMFYLALSLGMDDDVQGGLERMVGLVEAIGFEAGIEHPVVMTLGISDGKHIYAVRYSTEHRSHTLFHSRSIAALREFAPPELQHGLDRYAEGDRAIVSEPLTDIMGPWKEIPESTFITVENGDVHHEEFEPRR